MSHPLVPVKQLMRAYRPHLLALYCLAIVVAMVALHCFHAWTALPAFRKVSNCALIWTKPIDCANRLTVTNQGSSQNPDSAQHWFETLCFRLLAEVLYGSDMLYKSVRGLPCRSCQVGGGAKHDRSTYNGYQYISHVITHRQNKSCSSWVFKHPFPIDYHRSFYLGTFYLRTADHILYPPKKFTSRR